MFPFAFPDLHCSGPRKFLHNLAKLQKQLTTAPELPFTMLAPEREEMHHLPRPGWLRLLLLRGMKLAAGPSSCSQMTMPLVSTGLRRSFIKFNVKEEAEHTVPLSALMGWADSSNYHPDEKQRYWDMHKTIQVVAICCSTEIIRFNSCFYEHM